MRARLQQLPLGGGCVIFIGQNAIGTIAVTYGTKTTNRRDRHVELFTDPLTLVYPKRMPSVERTRRPRGVNMSVQKLLLDVLCDALLVLLRIDVYVIRTVYGLSLGSRFLPDELCVVRTQGYTDIVVEGGNYASLVIRCDRVTRF
jgi:hypothetical protein